MNVTATTDRDINSRDTIKAIAAAMNMVGVDEAPIDVPQGEIGGCVACGHTVVSHFRDGNFIGCPKGTASTVFVLVPMTRTEGGKERKGKAGGAMTPTTSQDRGLTGARTGGASTNSQTPAEPAIVARGFVRARYHSALHHKAKPEKLELSPTRLKVLRTIHESGREGLRARDIIKKARLPHGSVQQTLNWLRAHQLVTAKEDAEGGQRS